MGAVEMISSLSSENGKVLAVGNSWKPDKETLFSLHHDGTVHCFWKPPVKHVVFFDNAGGCYAKLSERKYRLRQVEHWPCRYALYTAHEWRLVVLQKSHYTLLCCR